MRFLFVLSLFAPSFVFAKPAPQKLCPKYYCSAPARGPSTHHYMTGHGYGNTILEGKRNAELNCVRSNAYGGCQEATCSKHHGPTFPIFSSCIDQWSQH